VGGSSESRDGGWRKRKEWLESCGSRGRRRWMVYTEREE